MKKLTERPNVIVEEFRQQIDKHLDDLENSRATEMLEIESFADLMFMHPGHLSNTIKEVTGTSACGIYQEKILTVAERLLGRQEYSIRDIAFKLDFEPSQFTKWFKRLKGITPKAFRNPKILK